MTPVQRLGGGLLIAAGVVMTGLAGACTVTFSFDGMGMAPGEHLSLLALGLVFGGPAMMAGAGLAWAGARLGWPDRRPVSPRWRGLRRLLAIGIFILFAALVLTALVNLLAAFSGSLGSFVAAGVGVLAAAVLFWAGRFLWSDPRPRPDDEVF